MFFGFYSISIFLLFVLFERLFVQSIKLRWTNIWIADVVYSGQFSLWFINSLQYFSVHKKQSLVRRAFLISLFSINRKALSSWRIQIFASELDEERIQLANVRDAR